MQKKRIVSTVIIGIFLLICIFFMTVLIPMNLSEAIREYSEQSSESIPESEEVGEMIIMVSLVYAIGALGILIAAHIMALIPLITSSICLSVALKNRTSYLRPVRVINVGYAIVFSAIIITSVVKIIIFWV